jgi:hypothetical protein
MIKSKRMRWAGYMACIREMKNVYRFLVGKPEGNRPFWGLRNRWEDISMNLKETGYEGVDWIHLAQDMVQWWALVNIIMNNQVPLKVENFCTRGVNIGFSRTLLHNFSY